MKSIGSYQAKTNLSKLLKKVSQGESYCITTNNKPVAMLVPFVQRPKMSIDEAIEGIKKFAKGNSLRGLSIKELINHGRR